MTLKMTQRVLFLINRLRIDDDHVLYNMTFMYPIIWHNVTFMQKSFCGVLS